jgi:Tfp pilus assembly protein PilF
MTPARCRRPIVGFLALLWGLWAPLSAYASAESMELESDGRVALRAGNDRDALALFERAVAADPEDMRALYYRGLARGRLAQWDGAIADLQHVLAERPEFSEAELQLGIVLVGAGRNAEAVAPLERAQQVPDLDPTASFFLATAQLRLGDQTGALANFERAAKSDTLHPAAAYYEGLLWYRARNWSRAEESLEYVVRVDPASERGRQAALLLARVREQSKPYSLYAEAGLQYDTNAIQAPSSAQQRQLLGIGSEADWRFNATAGGRYMPWQSGPVQLWLGYQFFQGLYFDMTSLDLQEHSPDVQVLFQSDRVEFGLLGRYDYDFLRGDSFLQQGTVLPWLRVHEGEFGSSELFYRFRVRDFLQNYRALPFNSEDNAAGVRQVVPLGAADRSLWLGYRFDRSDAKYPQGEPFAYDGNQVDVGVALALPWHGASSDLSYLYRHEDFAPASGGRRDNVHGLTFDLRMQLTDRVALSAAYYGTFNDSNMAVFTFDRNIGAVAVEVGF